MAKEKSKFQLNKGGSHDFDISKGSKRKFDLTKDTDEPEVTPVNPTSAPTPDTTSTPDPALGGAKSNKLIVWLFIIFAALLLIWWLWPSNASSDLPEQQTVEASTTDDKSPATEAAQPDETQSAETGTPEAAATEVPETAPAAATHATTEATASATPVVPETAPATAPAAVSDDIEAEALKVIRGAYGNNPDRRTILGDKYQDVQRRVNQLKRQGAF